MIRLLGAVMIFGGCLGMGLWYKESFVERIRVLRELQRIQEMLVSEIHYGKATLPECCRRIAEHFEEPYADCLMEIYNRMRENTGIIFGAVFREEMQKSLEGLPLKAEDKKGFLSMFSDKGYEDEGMQIRSIEHSKELLYHTVEKLERENGEKCKMAVSLGAMSGLLLLVILF